MFFTRSKKLEQCPYCDTWSSTKLHRCPVCGARRPFEWKDAADPFRSAKWGAGSRRKEIPPGAEFFLDMEELEWERSIAEKQKKRRVLCIILMPATMALTIVGALVVSRPLCERTESPDVLATPFPLVSESMEALNRTREEQEKTAEQEEKERIKRQVLDGLAELEAREGREAALACVMELLRLMPEDEEVMTTLVKLKDAGTRPLSSFRRFEESGGAVLEQRKTLSIQGQSFEENLNSGSAFLSYSGSASVEFFLDEEISTIEGYFAVPEASIEVSAEDKAWEAPRVAFLDGETGAVLRVFEDFSKHEEPRRFCVSLRGVRYLKIVFEGCRVNGGFLNLSVIQLLMIGDPVLARACA